MIAAENCGYAASVRATEQSDEMVCWKGDVRSEVRELLIDSRGEFVQWNACRVILHEAQSYGSECEVAMPRASTVFSQEREFSELLACWKEESAFLSSAANMAMLPSYQRIVGMGKAAVPWLLQELKREPDQYFWALRAITGADPVATSDRGCIPKMAQAWLEWGQKEGCL